MLVSCAHGAQKAVLQCPHGALLAVITDKAPNVLQLWTSVQSPAVFFASFEHPAVLPPVATMNCSTLAQNLTASMQALKPTYMHATALPFVVEFDDSNGNGIFNNDAPSLTSPLSTQAWTFAMDDTVVNFTTYDGVVQVQLYSHDASGRDAFNPYLLFDPLSVSVAFTVNNYSYTFANGKLAANLLFASSAADFVLSSGESVDDEYTPTVFKRNDVRASNLSFTNWKPVAFGDDSRDTSNDTFASPSSLSDPLPATALSTTLFGALFDASSVHVFQTNVSFGEPKDDAYQFPYITWSFVVGLGVPQEETFSSQLLTTIFVTNGLPALAFIFGGIYLAYKRMSAKPKYLLIQ